MRKLRTFGDEKTHLNLTNKAWKVYSNSDICIIEEETENRIIYNLCGAIIQNNLTEKDVNDVLESLEVIEDNLESLFINYPNYYMKVDCAFYSDCDKVMSGEQWLKYFEEQDKEILELTGIMTHSEADYYDFDIETF